MMLSVFIVPFLISFHTNISISVISIVCDLEVRSYFWNFKQWCYVLIFLFLFCKVHEVMTEVHICLIAFFNMHEFWSLLISPFFFFFESIRLSLGLCKSWAQTVILHINSTRFSSNCLTLLPNCLSQSILCNFYHFQEFKFHKLLIFCKL